MNVHNSYSSLEISSNIISFLVCLQRSNSVNNLSLSITIPEQVDFTLLTVSEHSVGQILHRGESPDCSDLI